MKKNKRELLKVLSVAGAAVAGWKKPVVNSVVLAAHAATSCELPAGCYLLFVDGVNGNEFVSWPGGAGPVLRPEIYESSNCTTDFVSDSSFFAYVVAASQQQAETAFAIAGYGDEAILLNVQPPEISPCVFYRSEAVIL